MVYVLRGCGWFSLPALVLGAFCAAARADLILLGVQYRADRSFPEYECFWRDSQYPGPCGASDPMGATVHVFLRNTGTSPVAVNDILLAGMSLKDSLVIVEQVVKRHPASIYFASLTPEELQTLLDAGEPVWYKTDPATIAPGSTAQAMVRLRQTPQTSTLNVGVVHTAGTLNATVPVAPDQPRPAGVSFSSDLAKAYIYWRRSPAGTAPVSILLDGIEVTAGAHTVSDPALNVAVTVLRPSQPFAPGSFHVFQAVYADGQTATAGVRAMANELIYGMWGAWPGADGDYVVARNYILDVTNHNINAQVVTLGSTAVQSYIKTAEGQQFAADHGLGFVTDDIGKWGVQRPYMWFIRDEPDAADFRVLDLPEDKKIGSLAQSAIAEGDYLRGGDPTVPTTINIDGTYKPYNWYNYGHVPDVLMSDPYYQARLRTALWSKPTTIPLYSKATYIYAVTQLAQSSGEPNPLHIVLYSCEYIDSSGEVFPFPTAESKRIEAYYALAGGAKGLSYWWYIPGSPANGVGAATVRGDPDAAPLWREIGLLGAEVRTAGPVLVTSCPVGLNVQTSPGLWARSLLARDDTLVLLAVNDNYHNDEGGCHYTPLTNASLTVDLPAWMASPTAFEIDAGGIRNISVQLSADSLQVNLGTVDLTRMIVVTTDSALRPALQQRYDGLFRTKVCNLAPELCAAANPPGITAHPQPQSVCSGDTASLTVAASGSTPLTYQWQKNQSDLVEGGRFSGATAATLTISGAGASDAADYRCVVSNAYGSATSNEAALAVSPCTSSCLQNPGFEAGFTAGVGNGWTKFNRMGNVTCSDETTEKHSGAHCQEVYSHDSANDGGVYQRFATVLGRTCSVTAWIKVYSPQGTGIAEGYLGIDPYGGTDSNSANIIWHSKPYDYWSPKTWTGTAQSNFVTVYLRGRSTKAASLNKTAYVWLDDVSVSLVKPDLDSDCDVDFDDFELFQACISGPATAPLAGCQNRDFDLDGDVDQTDFGIFQRCFSGTMGVDPACGD